MPKNTIDYNNTIIYKIVCNDLTIQDVYVGSTTNFTKRKHTHKNNCISEKYHNHNLKVYEFIRNNGGWSNWSMIEIEKYPCNNKIEAEKRERYWYEELNAKLNSRIPYITWEECNEYYIKNNIIRRSYTDAQKKAINKYYLSNKDKINQKKREAYQLKKELKKNTIN
jgi:hypothetical protein